MLLVGLFGPTACTHKEPAPGLPQSVLVITIDTLRADRLGCYGNPRGLTPEMDRLAAEGTRFENAIAPMPCTLPSHTSLFTGLSPRGHGVSDNFHPVAPQLTTLAELLSRHGFTCAAFFNVFPFDELNLAPRGFTVDIFDPDKRAGHIVPAFAKWLRDQPAGKRWFAWIHLFIPHAPLDPPEKQLQTFVTHPYSGPLDDRFETLERIRVGQLDATEDFFANYRDRYDAAVAFADEKVGQLRNVLEETGRLENVLLVLVADHGESLERGVVGLHSPVLAQSTLHVPLILRGPGVPARGTVIQLVQHPDLFPTILHAMQVAVPPGIEGRSVWPLVAGHVDGWIDCAVSFTPTRFKGKGKVSVDPERAAVRVGAWELVLVEGGHRMLYDLATDPREQHDVSTDRPDVMRNLAGAFEAALGTPTAALTPDLKEQLEKLGYPRSDSPGFQVP